jgi:hypothetical protein
LDKYSDKGINRKSSEIKVSKKEFSENNFEKSNPIDDLVITSPTKSETNEIVKKILE